MAFLERFRKKETEKVEVSVPTSNSLQEHQGTDVTAAAERMLEEVKTDLSVRNSIKLPIAEIATLGTGVSSLLPSLRTITQTISTSGTGLYRLVNANIGDALKAAKDGNLWGAMKTVSGTSKMAKFTEVGTLTSTSSVVSAINPAMLMMAAALASIEKRLDEVVKMEKQILSFLQEDKEAKIEGDLKTLTGIMKGYKFNWDNAEYTTGNHGLALGIKRSAEQNILFYQKQIAGVIRDQPLLHLNRFTDSVQDSLSKRFRYYRMSLYIYAFSSFLEVMLLGNFSEEYIWQVVERIESYSSEYMDLFAECASILERIAGGSVESQALKGFMMFKKGVNSLLLWSLLSTWFATAIKRTPC